MRRVLILTAVLCQSVFGYASYSGWCENGGVKVTVQGLTSSLTFQQSFPNLLQSATGPNVTVYAAGTTNKVTLYSDAAGTALNNPFPCSSSGQYQFFSTSEVVDVLFSGTGISPFTRSGIPIQEAVNYVSDQNGLSLSSNCSQAASRGATLTISKATTVSTLTCGANVYFYTGGKITYTGQITFNGSVDGDLSEHFIASGSPPTPVFTGSVKAFYPQWFGPAGTCTGPSVDSVVAVQAAVDAAIGRTVVLVGAPSSCAISAAGPGGAGGVTIYPNNSGMTLTSNATTPPGTYIAGAGGGLVAYAANPPAALLTLYAPANLLNLYLDGNNAAAAHGLISSMGANSIVNNVLAREFSGDGGQVFNEGTTATSITAGGGSGSSAVTVTSTTNNRLTFGTYYCSFVFFDYGLSNPEQIAISSVVGNVLHLASPTTHTHTTARCHGNSNDMHISRFAAYANGGRGFNVMPGSDNNAFYWSDASMNNNALGGELWSGSDHVHVGGNYQGDAGPAIQLGDITGAWVTHFMTIGPPGDIEESSGAFNVTDAVCDDSSSVYFTISSKLTIESGGSACPTYAAGTTTTGFGTGNTQLFTVKNSGGSASYGPGAPFISTAVATMYKTPNFICSAAQGCDTGHRECTGVGTPDASCTAASANNAITATLRDPNGNLVTIADGLRITITLTHSLQAGANTITLNGVMKSIASAVNPANPTVAYAVGGTPDMVYANGVFLVQ